MPVVVHLFTVEAALLLQAAESLTELQELRPPALTVQTLLPDVLTEETHLLLLCTGSTGV